MTDDLAALLGPHPAPPAGDALYRQSLRVLRRAMWRRRAAAASGVLAVFAGGTILGWVAKPTPAPVTVTEFVPVPVPVPDSSSLAQQPAPRSPAELELAAEANPVRAESARLFREAGDKYLTDANDIASATRCYVNHLSDAGRPAVSADDSWLLLRLKLSRTKED